MNNIHQVWKSFENNEISHSAAHYLIAINEASLLSEKLRAADLSRTLKISRNAVSLKLRVLAESGLLLVEEDHSITLTDKGKEIANSIISKRAALKYLLRNVLGISEENAEKDSCKIEHLISNETGAAIAKLVKLFSKGGKLPHLFLESLRKNYKCCPGGNDCIICNHTCLLDEGKTESKEKNN